MRVDLVLEVEQAVAVAVVHEVAPALAVGITLGPDPVGVVLAALGFTHVDDLVAVVGEVSVDMDGPVGVEALVVARGQFPTLVFELGHVQHREGAQGDTLVGRDQRGGTRQTVVHALLEGVEAHRELVAQAEVDTDVHLLDLLGRQGSVAVDGLVGVILQPADVAAADGGHLVLVVVTAVARRVVTGDRIGGAHLEEGQPGSVLLDEGLVRGDPRGAHARGPQEAGAPREVVRSGVAGRQVEGVAVVVVVEHLGAGVQAAVVIRGRVVARLVDEALVQGVGAAVDMVLAEVAGVARLALVGHVAVEGRALAAAKRAVDVGTQLREVQLRPVVVAVDALVALVRTQVRRDVGQVADARLRPQARGQEVQVELQTALAVDVGVHRVGVTGTVQQAVGAVTHVHGGDGRAALAQDGLAVGVKHGGGHRAVDRRRHEGHVLVDGRVGCRIRIRGVCAHH